MTSWYMSNVHQWSKTMSDILRRDMPGLVVLSTETARDINVPVLKRHLPADLHPVIDKVYDRRNLIDKDLCGVNPAGLLHIAWTITPKDSGGYAALADLLRDMGNTCLQGDTHRLFSYIYALRASTA